MIVHREGQSSVLAMTAMSNFAKISKFDDCGSVFQLKADVTAFLTLKTNQMKRQTYAHDR